MNEALSQHNPEMELAWKLVSTTSQSVFLTGNAGTGKTTFLRRLREESPKRMVVLAPTGVAAINAQGQTIHSFFQLPFGPIIQGDKDTRRQAFRMSEQKKKLIRTLDLLVIDEISMVRADLLDAVDAELRRFRDRYKPFGGVQLLLIGDLQQLPPVVKESEWSLLKDKYATAYFFGSRALQDINLAIIQLKKIYRQQDAEFIDILAKIRNNCLDAPSIASLNRRVVSPGMLPEQKGWIRLTTHNRTADDYNARMLASLSTPVFCFDAKVEGNFPDTSYPADFTLQLKVGAQVMFIKNDTEGHKFYNGKIGEVTSIEETKIYVHTKEDDQTIEVPVATWANTKYALNEDSNEIEEQVDGTFSQYPLRLAWAITVHKSQGLTFDHAVLDINESFAHGQVYVALSRCRTLDGLVLSRPINVHAVITDSSVNQYVSATPGADEISAQLPSLMAAYYRQLLDELFDFKQLAYDVQYLKRVASEHLYKKYPNLGWEIGEAEKQLVERVTLVAYRFSGQYQARLQQLSENYGTHRLSPDEDEWLSARLNSAFGYFLENLKTAIAPIIAFSQIKIDNKQTATQFKNAMTAIVEGYKLKQLIFAQLARDGFSVKNYLNAKARALTDPDAAPAGKKRRK